jgi:hypothetical protein
VEAQLSDADLIPGFTHRRRGTSSYGGVLRESPRSLRPSWLCVHDHLTAMSATACAVHELENRKQGRQEVFYLLRCEPCQEWFDAPEVGGLARCPLCGVPMARLKVIVVERIEPVDAAPKRN